MKKLAGVTRDMALATTSEGSSTPEAVMAAAKQLTLTARYKAALVIAKAIRQAVPPAWFRGRGDKAEAQSNKKITRRFRSDS